MTKKSIKSSLHSVIFESNTPLGKLFDIVLLIVISFSVIIVMIDSVENVHNKYGDLFLYLEWIITIIFTIEYALRIFSSIKPTRYIFSFYGIIDLLSILPTYISLVIAGTHFLIVIRMLRLMRIFRILKLVRYVRASNVLAEAIKSSRRTIIVFLEAIIIIVVITGSLMYLIEGPEMGFTSIPKSIYWAIVTITTVGYGDIVPQTALGQTIASMLMIVGFAIIAVPTSIIGGEIIKGELNRKSDATCIGCNCSEHDEHAKYCKQCGKEL